MKMMSTGQPSTLGNWYEMCKAWFGPESSATRFIKEKMDRQGPDMEVVADEGQLVDALMGIHVAEAKSSEADGQ